MKKIGILGSGMVAQTLGSGFIKHGYQVMLGTRDTGKLAGWQQKEQTGNVGSFADAAAYGDIVVPAVSGKVVASVLDQIGSAPLKGKTIIEQELLELRCCPPLAGDATGNFPCKLEGDSRTA